MKKQLEAVKLFHQTFGAPVSETPTLIPGERSILRFNLMKEENEEYHDAVVKGDKIEIADALGDMLYILCGTIIEHGLQHKIVEVFDEIQASNMSKLGEDGKPILREDGKVMKGPNYFKPNIQKIFDKRKIILIAALSGNEVIAKDGKIPWHLPNDFKHFKEVTSGHHIIMGRKTFESLPKMLPNRTHVVITRNKDYHKLDEEGVIIVHSLEEAIEVCPVGESSYVIGGGEIYKEAISIADELDLTIVDTMVTGENLTRFPNAMQCMGQFKVLSRLSHPVDLKHEFPYAFLKLERK